MATLLLTGKRILVTGGARGLGRAICLECARQGARVAFTFAHSPAEAEQTLAELRAIDARCASFLASVLEREPMEALVAGLQSRWGGIDVLVNNAGVSAVIPLALMEEEDWDEVMGVNVKGCYLASRAVLRGMIQRQGGVILNIGSIAGVRMIAAPVHYSASKAAVRGFTESLAKEVSRYRIRVNCLAAGLLEGGVSARLPEPNLREFLEQVSLRRVGTFAEVAALAAFLVSDRNSYMNGATVVADGGL